MAAPSWIVSNDSAPRPDPWTVTRDKKGRRVFTENVPPTLDALRFERPSDRSKFTIEIREACLIGGHAAGPDDTVICFAPTATLLVGRGKITREQRNAF
jgi:hypothetical protein